MKPTREDFPIVYTMSTRWNDNDHYGHMNNATYFEYIDTAVNGWLMQATGIDIRDLPAIGIVASTGCDYFAELGFPDTIEIGLATTRIGTSSISYRLGIFRAGDPELRALAHFVHVYVDADTRRPVPIPGAIRAAVEGARGRGRRGGAPVEGERAVRVRRPHSAERHPLLRLGRLDLQGPRRAAAKGRLERNPQARPTGYGEPDLGRRLELDRPTRRDAPRNLRPRRPALAVADADLEPVGLAVLQPVDDKRSGQRSRALAAPRGLRTPPTMSGVLEPSGISLPGRTDASRSMAGFPTPGSLAWRSAHLAHRRCGRLG